MLETVSSDLALLRDVLSGRTKPQQQVRQLLAALRKDVLPSGWYRAGMPKNLAPSVWMEDFVRRLTQIQKLVGLHPSEYSQVTIWLGGLQARITRRKRRGVVPQRFGVAAIIVEHRQQKGDRGHGLGH